MIYFHHPMAHVHITPKQLEILLLLYRFRFLNRHQLQHFLNHKDPKRLNTWLKHLTTHNIIGRHYSTKLKENTKPAIYYLTTGAKQILSTQPTVQESQLKRVYREKHRSLRLQDHCIFLADFYLLLETYATTQQATLHYFSATDLVTHYYLPKRQPDAYIALTDATTTRRYFVLSIDAGTPRFMIRSLISHYLEYLNTPAWQKQTGHPNPSILIICPDDTFQTFLHQFGSQALEEELSEAQLFTGLKDDILSRGLQPDTWHLIGSDYLESDSSLDNS